MLPGIPWSVLVSLVSVLLGVVTLIFAHKEPQSEDLSVLYYKCGGGGGSIVLCVSPAASILAWAPTRMFPNFQSLSIPAWNFTGGLPCGGQGGGGGGSRVSWLGSDRKRWWLAGCYVMKKSRARATAGWYPLSALLTKHYNIYHNFLQPSHLPCIGIFLPSYWDQVRQVKAELILRIMARDWRKRRGGRVVLTGFFCWFVELLLL